MKELVLPISCNGCIAAAANEGLGLCPLSEGLSEGSEGLLWNEDFSSDRALGSSSRGNVFERRSRPNEPKSKPESVSPCPFPVPPGSPGREGLRGGGGMAGIVGTSSLLRSNMYFEFDEAFETECE